MKDKVAVIGVGCTKFGDQFDRSYEDMARGSRHAAFADAGIEPSASMPPGWVPSRRMAVMGKPP